MSWPAAPTLAPPLAPPPGRLPTAMASAAMTPASIKPPSAPTAVDPALISQMQRAASQSTPQDAWSPSAAGATPEAEGPLKAGEENFLDTINPMKGMTPWHFAAAPAMGIGAALGLEYLMDPGANLGYERMMRVAGKVDRFWGIRHLSDLLQHRVIAPLTQHSDQIASPGWCQTVQSLLYQLPPEQEEARILKSIVNTLEKRVDPATFAKMSAMTRANQLESFLEGIPKKEPLRKQLGAFFKRFDYLKSTHLPNYAKQYHLQQTALKKGLGPVGRTMLRSVDTLRRVASGSTMGLARAGFNPIAALFLGLTSFGPALVHASKAESLWEGVKTFAHDFMGGIVGNFLGWEIGRMLIDKTMAPAKILGSWANKTTLRLPFTQFARLSLVGTVTELGAALIFGSIIQSGFEWLSHKIFGKPKLLIEEERAAQSPPPKASSGGLARPGGFDAFSQAPSEASSALPAAASMRESKDASASIGDVSWIKRNRWANQDAETARKFEDSLPPIQV